jgi:hypothetical protein
MRDDGEQQLGSGDWAILHSRCPLATQSNLPRRRHTRIPSRSDQSLTIASGGHFDELNSCGLRHRDQRKRDRKRPCMSEAGSTSHNCPFVLPRAVLGDSETVALSWCKFRL